MAERLPSDGLLATGLALAGPVTVTDLLPMLDAPAGRIPWASAGSPLITTLIHEYRRRGMALTIFTTDDALAGRPEPWMRLSGDGLTVYVVPRRRHAYRWQQGRPGRIVDLFALERLGLQQAMRHAQPALVHAHWSYEYAWAAQDSLLPTLITCHDSPTAILRQVPDVYRAARWCMARRVLARAGAVTVVSPYLVDELARWLRASPTVVANPLPDAVLQSGQARLHGARLATAPRIGMVLNGWGNLKNAIPGMAAMARLRQTLPQAQLHLIGPDFGPGEMACRWANQAGLQADFQFHGRLSHAATLAQMAQFDLLIHPALEESFGLSVAEAMALGLPVVAGRASGAVPWVLGGNGATLVDVRSADEILQAMRTLLADPKGYELASHAGRSRAVQVFSVQAVADQYLALYADLLGQTTGQLSGVMT